MKDLRARAPKSITQRHGTSGTTDHISAAYQEVADRASSLYGESARFRNEPARNAASQPNGYVAGTPLQVINGGAQ